MLLPFIATDCDSKTGKDLEQCKKDREDIAIIMVAMQTKAPNTAIDATNILPILFMDDKDGNGGYDIYNMMQQKQQECWPLCTND